MSAAMPSFFRARTHHVVVIVRLVRDVAGHVLLLDAADAMLEPRRPRAAPRAARASAVADVGEEPLALVRLGREGRPGSRAASPRSGISHGSEPLARPSRPRAPMTGVHVLDRDAARPRSRHVKHCDGVDGGDDRHRALAVASVERLIRSACSVLVGMPVDGPARWMSKITSGSSARPRARWPRP